MRWPVITDAADSETPWKQPPHALAGFTNPSSAEQDRAVAMAKEKRFIRPPMNEEERRSLAPRCARSNERAVLSRRVWLSRLLGEEIASGRLGEVDAKKRLGAR